MGLQVGHKDKAGVRRHEDSQGLDLSWFIIVSSTFLLQIYITEGGRLSEIHIHKNYPWRYETCLALISLTQHRLLGLAVDPTSFKTWKSGIGDKLITPALWHVAPHSSSQWSQRKKVFPELMKSLTWPRKLLLKWIYYNKSAEIKS